MSTQYSGHSMVALIAVSDEVLRASNDFRAKTTLHEAQLHLEVPSQSENWSERDDNDAYAQTILDEVRYCIETDRTTLCRYCNKMEGLHSFNFGWCLDPPCWSNPPQLMTTFLPYPDGRKA